VAESLRKKDQLEEEAKQLEAKSEAKLREAYELKKKEEEEKQRLKQQEEKRKREEGRKKVAEKSSLWSKGTDGKDIKQSVIKSIGSAKLSSGTKTKDFQGLLGDIRRGADLHATPGKKVASEELTDDMMADFVVESIRKRSSICMPMVTNLPTENR